MGGLIIDNDTLYKTYSSFQIRKAQRELSQQGVTPTPEKIDSHIRSQQGKQRLEGFRGRIQRFMRQR